jgi:hypothetical protein
VIRASPSTAAETVAMLRRIRFPLQPVRTGWPRTASATLLKATVNIQIGQ